MSMKRGILSLAALALLAAGAGPALSQSPDMRPSASSDWGIGTAKRGEKWMVRRVKSGCMLMPNDSNPVDALYLTAHPSEPWSGIGFTGAKALPYVSKGLLPANLSLDGKPIALVGAAISNDTGDDWALTFAIFKSSDDKVFDGKPVTVWFKHKDLVLTGTVDATASDMAMWRDCVATMRGK